jgi:release factor glutamine methyltransferase
MVYEPAEDSFLIKKEVERLAKGDVLEIGTGSGILAEAASKSKKVKSVVAVDIKKEAIEYCIDHVKDKKITFIVSDLFSKVPKQKFDTIIFNPPYLPAEKGESWDIATEVSGGKHGYELTERFIAEVNDYLDTDGIVLLLFSTLTGKFRVDQFIKDALMQHKELSMQKISFEQLFVYEIKKSALRKLLEKKGIGNIKPLAKGHRGLIFIGCLKNKKVTIKVQRDDIDATETVNNEVRQLAVLNKHNIGPKLLFSGNNYFVYEFVDGDFLQDYLAKKETNRSGAIKVIKDVFEQMYVLDTLGLNKEEMHHPVKHIIVTRKGKPVLVDFERCHSREKTHNVTQFAQFIISGKLLPYLERHKIKVSMLEMLDISRKYSEKKSRENFDAILALLH